MRLDERLKCEHKHRNCSRTARKLWRYVSTRTPCSKMEEGTAAVSLTTSQQEMLGSTTSKLRNNLQPCVKVWQCLATSGNRGQ